MRYISRCFKQASIFYLISKFWKTSKTSIFQANNPEKAPSETNFRSWCDFEGTWLRHYQSLIFKFENGMHTKNFKNNQNFTIFEILKIFVSLFLIFLYHHYWFIAYWQRRDCQRFMEKILVIKIAAKKN